MEKNTDSFHGHQPPDRFEISTFLRNSYGLTFPKSGKDEEVDHFLEIKDAMISYVEVTGLDKEKVDAYFDSLLVKLAAKGNSIARDRLSLNPKVNSQADSSPRFTLRNKKKVHARVVKKSKTPSFKLSSNDCFPLLSPSCNNASNSGQRVAVHGGGDENRGGRVFDDENREGGLGGERYGLGGEGEEREERCGGGLPEKVMVSGGNMVEHGGVRVAVEEDRSNADCHGGDERVSLLATRGDEPRHEGDVRKVVNAIDSPSIPKEPSNSRVISNSKNGREHGLDVGLAMDLDSGPSAILEGTTNGPTDGDHGPTCIRPIGPRGTALVGPKAIGPFGPKVDLGLASFLDVLAGKTKSTRDGPETNGPIHGEPKERVSFSSLLKKAHELDDTRLSYTAPTVLDDGSKVVDLTVDMVERGSRLYVNQLYGYFIGTSMDFRAVQASVRRLWRKYDFESMGKNTAGFYFFKFKSEEGMLSVLRDGPWLVDQVPLFLHQWEPGVTLTKVEPKKVQIWIAIHDMSPDLWTGECVGALASRIGRPCFMDKPTTERCVKQMGRINYARVLVEIDAKDEVPKEIQVRYPPIRGREGFVKCLRVSYQWKPKRCSICEVFGHSTSTCKHNPDIPKDQPKGDGAHTTDDTTNRVGEEGFIKVGKKDKGKEKVVTNVRQEYRVRHDPRVPPKVTPPTAPSKDPTPPRPPKATTPKSSTHPTHPSPPRDCTVNSHNRFEILSDDEEDVENVYMEDGDVYPDDSGTAKFMELEDRYA